MTRGRATEARSLTYLSICSHAHVGTLGSRLGLGAVLALPAVIALIFDTNTGLALAVGILPVVALPVAPSVADES